MGQVRPLNGNSAAAYGTKLSRVQVICSYPITPQTTVVEYLSEFVNNGELKAEYIEAEGEYGMMSQAIGASVTGARAFAATCSQGFAYAYEPITFAWEARTPVVMVVVNRPIGGFWPDHTDSLSARDWPWLQLYAENAQEALDNVIQAYRIGEDARVHLPVMACHDGFYMSYVMEPVDIPDQGEVDKFLPPFKPQFLPADPKNPSFSQLWGGPQKVVGIPGLTLASMANRVAAEQALIASKTVIKQVNEEFGRRFGRRYGNGLIEEHQTADAEVLLITMGSMSGPAKLAINELRKEGKRVGLVRIRAFRPFPTEDFQRLSRKVKTIVVCDRNVVQDGSGGVGAAYLEIKHALWYQPNRPLLLNFIVGLRGVEVATQDFKYIGERALEAASKGKVEKEVEWYPTIELLPYEAKSAPPEKLQKLTYPGTTACQGCGMVLAFRHTLDTLGRNTIIIPTAGCGGWATTGPGMSGYTVPMVMSWLPGGGATATGVARGLKALGKDKGVNVVLFTGDGSFGDMGFMSGSGAAERNEDILIICYDNEAYMNTGNQRSGSTPYKSRTETTPVGTEIKGKQAPKKDLPAIMAAHQIPYVATASLAYLADFKRKLKKAASIRGCKYIHVISPCPTGWRHPTEDLIKISRLAVQSGIWPLYEIEEGKFRYTYKPKERVPVKEYMARQGRFSHMTEKDVSEVQAMVDTANTKYEDLEKIGAGKA